MALERKHLRDPAVLWASALGVGFLPRAPGTWGSVAAVAVWWVFLSGWPASVQLGVCAVYFFSGWWCSQHICRHYGVDDAPQIVADEVAGMWLALALLPALWWLALFAFALFRWLDIAKPGPIGWLDREVKGGLGVMLDDVVAGMVAGTVLYFSLWALQTTGIAPV